MVKKFALFIIILAFIGGGFFYWWSSQADVRELNKTLPEGVRVIKSLIGDEYKVVNKIDNYEFKIPPEWQGVREVEYIPERTEKEYIAASIGLEGNEGTGKIIAIDQFRSTTSISSLKNWAENNLKTFGLTADFNEGIIGEFEVVKTQEFLFSVLGYIYFFKNDSVIYAITCGSEEYIYYIITNGKW